MLAVPPLPQNWPLKTKDFLTQKFKIPGFSYSLNVKLSRRYSAIGLKRH
jgi:hypothetical protein